MPAFYNIKFNSIANNTFRKCLAEIPPSMDLPFSLIPVHTWIVKLIFLSLAYFFHCLSCCFCSFSCSSLQLFLFMQWSPTTPKGIFLIRCQHQQTLWSTIPCWTVYLQLTTLIHQSSQLQCQLLLRNCIDDENASVTSSCSWLACDFCLHSYSVVHIPASEWQTPAKLCNTRNNARHDISSGIRILSACNGTHPSHSAISTC